jgi:hypothetical protein
MDMMEWICNDKSGKSCVKFHEQTLLVLLGCGWQNESRGLIESWLKKIGQYMLTSSAQI